MQTETRQCWIAIRIRQVSQSFIVCAILANDEEDMFYRRQLRIRNQRRLVVTHHRRRSILVQRQSYDRKAAQFKLADVRACTTRFERFPAVRSGSLTLVIHHVKFRLIRRKGCRGGKPASADVAQHAPRLFVDGGHGVDAGFGHIETRRILRQAQRHNATQWPPFVVFEAGARERRQSDLSLHRTPVGTDHGHAVFMRQRDVYVPRIGNDA